MFDTFDISKTTKIFNFLVKEKYIAFPLFHQVPTKEDLRRKTYYKYHNSWNHVTNSSWGFKSVVLYKINKGIIKFPKKKEVMVVEEDYFPPVSIVNTSIIIELKEILAVEKAKNMHWLLKSRRYGSPIVFLLMKH